MNIQNNYLVRSYPNRAVSMVSGKGCYLTDTTGKQYLDMGSNYGVNIFGYNHRKITKALSGQLTKLVNLHGSFESEVRATAARKLVKRCGGKISQVFFSNSGAEAVEAALKFARYYSHKTKFVAMSGGYHGKTLGALSATAGEKYRKPFLPLLWNFSHIPFGDIDSLKGVVAEDTAGVIFEVVQGEGGIKLFARSYFTKLQEICRERKILLICDEIQSGMGRTGTFLACEQYGITPDIILLGKGLAGGLPIGATLVSREIGEAIPLHLHTSTFGGNPLTMAGINAVLGQLSPEVLSNVQAMGSYLLASLKKINNKHIKEVRGIGLMVGVEVDIPVTPILKGMQDRGVIVIPAGSSVVRFLPPLIITKSHIDAGVKSFVEVLKGL